MKQQRADQRALAWHVANLSNAKRLPDFADYVSPPEAPPSEEALWHRMKLFAIATGAAITEH